jgi:general secretion pathway protein F
VSEAGAAGAAGAGRAFRYRAVGRDGRPVTDVVRATDERAALKRLTEEGLTVTRVDEVAAGRRALAARGLRLSERVLIMRQLALMLEAGVPLLEALETVTQGIESRTGRAQFEAVSAALRQGEPLGKALAEHAPGFPFYVYPMADIGEASGRVPDVLRQAAEQMAYEHGLRRDFVNALTYPAFLAVAGLGAIGFIFIEVVPRFSAMIGEDTSRLPALSRAVLGAGNFASANPIAVLLGIAAVAAVVALALTQARPREQLRRVAYATPILGAVLRTREIATWARLTAFALANGLDILSAVDLSRRAIRDGALRRGLAAFESDLKAGVAIDASLSAHTRLTPMDLSLVRVGQRSGTLARMFGFLADGYEARLKDAVKRFTAVIEPTAIGLIAILVGVVALALVMALSSLYETVY